MSHLTPFGRMAAITPFPAPSTPERRLAKPQWRRMADSLEDQQ